MANKPRNAAVRNQIVKPKIFVFIDAENIRNSMEAYGYRDLDYAKVYSWLTGTVGVSRIYIYAGIEQGDTLKRKQFDDLKKLGFLTTTKKVMLYKQLPINLNVSCPNCNHGFVKTINRHNKPKANCDAELTLDVINCGVRKKYDEIIVFSGDGDFSRVYEYVAQQLKKKVTVYSPLSGQQKMRTSLKIKDLSKSGIVKLNDLGSLLQHYGSK